MRYIVIIATVCLLFTACKKIETQDRYVYGQIVNDSTGVPMEPTTFVLVTSWTESFGKDQEESFAFATDENGNFKVKFRAKAKSFLAIGYPGASRWEGKNQSELFWGSDPTDETEINAGLIKTSKP